VIGDCGFSQEQTWIGFSLGAPERWQRRVKTMAYNAPKTQYHAAKPLLRVEDNAFTSVEAAVSAAIP
jgi:hypothetical protein